MHKKMLWRANLYIDERQDGGDTVADWNDLHPWSYGNEWAISEAETEDGRAYVAGGQNIGFQPWTRWSDGASVDSAVAYGWGGRDGVAVFNDKLAVQRDLLAGVYNEDGGLLAEPGDGESADPWNVTTAPGQDWQNYQMPTYVEAQGTYTPEGATDPVSFTYWDVTSPLAGTLYVPGLSTYNAFNPVYVNDPLDEDSPNAGNYHPNQVVYSAGLDCSGLVQRAVSYRPPNGDPHEVSLGEANSTSMIAENANSWMVAPAALDENTPYAGLERVVPGDIIIRIGHVMIVTAIDYPDDGSSPQPENFTVIHSRGGSETPTPWQVMTRESWADPDVAGLAYRYAARRLR